MELLPGILADGCALFVQGAKTLILSDLHIGYEEEVRQRGVLLPQGQRDWFAKELDRLIAAHKPKTVILAGDVKHEFSRISQEEWSDVQRLIRGIQQRGCAVEVVGGNHDVLIGPILKKLDVELKKYLVIDVQNKEEQSRKTKMSTAKKTVVKQRILVVHGDATLDDLVKKEIVAKELLKGITTIIIGHEHPALTISDGVRHETVKCFLAGKFRHGKRNSDMIVMPSFNPLAFGTDVLRERPLGPLLAAFGGFSAFAILDDQVLAFGDLEKLQRLQRA